jgi:hypothetical protein
LYRGIICERKGLIKYSIESYKQCKYFSNVFKNNNINIINLNNNLKNRSIEYFECLNFINNKIENYFNNNNNKENSNNNSKILENKNKKNYNNNSFNLDENNNNNNNYVENYNNEKSSPFVKLSLDKDDLKNYKGLDEKMKQKLIDEYSGKKNINNINNNNKNSEMEDEINNLTNEVKNLNFQKKIVSKKVEITTKILYTFEDGSTKQIEEKITHNF